jgi:CBS domain-containing protein
VRSLALRDHVQATGPAARLDALVARSPPGRAGPDLADSLHFLMGLPLKAGLAEWTRGVR